VVDVQGTLSELALPDSLCASLLDENIGGRFSINGMRLTISVRNTKHLK
jgi:hypothetical protein